jgi:hypothetical protein
MEDYIKFLEDMEDLAAVAERRDELQLNHDQFLAELRKDGILLDHFTPSQGSLSMTKKSF